MSRIAGEGEIQTDQLENQKHVWNSQYTEIENCNSFSCGVERTSLSCTQSQEIILNFEFITCLFELIQVLTRAFTIFVS